MIGTILLCVLILATLCVVGCKLIGGPIYAAGDIGTDLLLYVCWIGYGIKQLFWS